MKTPTALPFYRIGARIKAARVATALSQESFASRIGTSRRHVMRLERGQHKPSEPMLARISAVTGVPVTELLGDDEDEEAAMSFAAALDVMFNRAVDQRVREILAERVTV